MGGGAMAIGSCSISEGKDGFWTRGLAMEMADLKEYVIEKHGILLIINLPM